MAYNNVYLVSSGSGRVLIDTGPDYRGAREHIDNALGGRIPDLVVATHGHLDHAGLGGWWEARGVPVALSERDAHFASGHQLDDAEFAHLVRFVEDSGAPSTVVAEAIHGLEQRREWAAKAASASGYRPGGRDGRWPTGLRSEPFTPSRWLNAPMETTPAGAMVLALPGHTPGNSVVWLESEGWLFSGDQLLPEIMPTPALQAIREPGSDWRFRSLPEFLRSLRLVRELGASRCFPGHGEPFTNVDEVIVANIAQAEQRSEKVREVLRERQGESLYGLAHELYPRALRRRFWQIIATVQGHLDVLEGVGEARNVEGHWFSV